MSRFVAFHRFRGQMFKHKTRSAGEDVQRLKIPKKGPIGPFSGLLDNSIPAIDSSCDHFGPIVGKPAPTGFVVAGDVGQYTDTVGAGNRDGVCPDNATFPLH